MKSTCRGYYCWCLCDADLLQMATNLPFFQPPLSLAQLSLLLCPSNPLVSDCLSLYLCLTFRTTNPSSALTCSFRVCFSRSVQRGLWAAQLRIWRLFSTVSCVTSSTSDTRNLTTTSTPTTMHTNRYMGGNYISRTHTLTTHKHTIRHVLCCHIMWVCLHYVDGKPLYISMSIRDRDSFQAGNSQTGTSAPCLIRYTEWSPHYPLQRIFTFPIEQLHICFYSSGRN